MSNQDPITLWLHELGEANPDAAGRLWDHFCSRMERLAKAKLDPITRRTYDESDAANSAFHSFCRGVEKGRFNDLVDRDNLWKLLAVITARKVSRQQRSERRHKRGGGKIKGDSIFASPNLERLDGGLNEFAGREPSPEFAAEMLENCERLFGKLEHKLRQIAEWKMENLNNREIAERLDCTRRTVERKLEIIRRIWADDI